MFSMQMTLIYTEVSGTEISVNVSVEPIIR